LDRYDFSQLTFLFEDEELQDDKTLEHYNIEHYHSIVAVIKNVPAISTTKSAIITTPQL
jgi:hypothetical protein